MDGAAAAALDSSDLSRDWNDLWRDSDAALAARASRGDARAFERLHARWAARVERFAVSRLGSREDAGLPRPVTRESAEAEGRTVQGRTAVRRHRPHVSADGRAALR